MPGSGAATAGAAPDPGESGWEKFTDTNWFGELDFPFPFSLLPASVSWQISTWFELLGAAALMLRLATRFFTVSLMVLTLVAIASVHWPEHWMSLSGLLRGYRVVDEAGDGFGNYKLPLIYLVMFLHEKGQHKLTCSINSFHFTANARTIICCTSGVT